MEDIWRINGGYMEYIWSPESIGTTDWIEWMVILKTSLNIKIKHISKQEKVIIYGKKNIYICKSSNL